MQPFASPRVSKVAAIMFYARVLTVGFLTIFLRFSFSKDDGTFGVYGAKITMSHPPVVAVGSLRK